MKNRKTMTTTEVPMKKKEIRRREMVSPKVPLDEYKRMKGIQEGVEEGMQGVAQNRFAAKFAREGAEEGMQEVAQNFVNERLNSIPFKNSSINVFDKKRYDISREFDGQEVPGSLTVRPTLFGGTVETERFDIPGAGTSTSRVRKNAEGQTVRRVVKDKNIN